MNGYFCIKLIEFHKRYAAGFSVDCEVMFYSSHMIITFIMFLAKCRNIHNILFGSYSRVEWCDHFLIHRPTPARKIAREQK